jgi:hypothetical protein
MIFMIPVLGHAFDANRFTAANRGKIERIGCFTSQQAANCEYLPRKIRGLRKNSAARWNSGIFRPNSGKKSADNRIAAEFAPISPQRRPVAN